ncbi:MAG TPA: nuclear transport factor 2 family protein, partial [Saprospiraceae bacterium]|nr:nuclear transport factor 2 family protein [Saprospiraceae bacterium]
AAGVRADEQRRFEAMTRRDTAGLRRLLHEGLVYIHSNALTETRQQHLTSIGEGKIVYENMSAQGVRVRRFGKTALTNGTLQVKGMLGSSPFDLRLAYTAVYRKQQGTWRLLNWQSTRIP